MNDEIRMFSASSADEQWGMMLRQTSRSEEDALRRKSEYGKVFSNYVQAKEVAKTFSGMAEMPLLSNQYFNATMASYVRSFAGFLTIERSMDQPTALLWYMDLLGVTDNRRVLPNYGKEDLQGINAKFSTQAPISATTAEYSIATNKKLIPGTVEITLINSAEPNRPIVIRDDRRGNLLAPAGVLAANSGNVVGVDYRRGNITFNINGVADFKDGSKYSLSAFEDAAGDPAFGQLTGPGNNRFKLGNNNIVVTTEPDMLIAENNLMAIAAMQKSIGVDPAEVTGAKLTELYTKLINGKFVKGLQDMNDGNGVTINISKAAIGYADFSSYLQYFESELVNVDTALAKKSYKGIKATAYVVGETAGNWFQKLTATGSFVPNTESTYINDLLGHYKGIPVLRHMDLAADENYAVCKTADGQLAPLMRGIYLPLTNTPVVGNYNNPSQFASGVYYQEANAPIVPELMIPFKVTDDNSRVSFDVYSK